jgi:ribosomal protein L7/L12
VSGRRWVAIPQARLAKNVMISGVTKGESTMRKAYSQVIELIAANMVDYKRVALELAKVCPAAFIALSGNVSVSEYDKLNECERKILGLIQSDKFILAIKTHREQTGSGLKESKDFCDDLKRKAAAGLYDNPAKSDLFIADMLREALNFHEPVCKTSNINKEMAEF